MMRYSPMSIDQRWFYQLFIAIFVCIGNGSVFCFGIFSPFMKTGKFNFNQEQVNIVSTTAVVLSYCSLPTGYLYDKYGPKATLIVGGIMSFIGWTGMYLIFVDETAPLLGTSVFVMSFFYGIASMSASFFETGSVLTNLEAFSLHQGRIIMIQKTFMGLGSSIISQMYIAFFQDFPVASFFLFLGIFMPVTGIYAGHVLKLPTPATRVFGLNAKEQREDISDTSHLLASTAGGAAPPAPAAVAKQSSSSPTAPASIDRIVEEKKYAASAEKKYDASFRFGIAVLLTVVAFIASATIVEEYVAFSHVARISVGVVTILLVFAFGGMVALAPASGGKSSPVHSCDDDRGPIPAHAPSGGRTVKRRENDAAGGDVGSEQTSVVVVYGSLPQVENESPLQEQKPTAAGEDDSAAHSTGLHTIHPVHTSKQTFRLSSYQGIVGRNGAVWFLNDSPLSVNIRTPELALMWVVSFGVWGTTTLITSNSSQIYQSLDFEHYKATTNVVYVSIFGVASALGRIAVGALQPILIEKGLHIVTMFPVAPVINIVALPLFFIMPANSIILPFFLIGLATGVTWGSTVLIIKSLFHPKHTGMHYNVLYTAGMLTPIVMNIALFGPLYDKHSEEQGLSATHSCRGTVCVVIPMMVSLALNIVAFAAAYIFYRRVSLKGGI